MGACCTAQSPPGAGLVGHSAKAWLGLEGTPASYQIARRPGGASGIVIKVAGMDTYGLLGEMEAAFLRRGLVVESSQWSVRRSLFHASFHLGPAKTAAGVEASDRGSVTKVAATYCTREFTPKKCYSRDGTRQLEDHDIAHVKVEMVHTMGSELRTGFLRLVHAAGGHTCHGEVSTVPASAVGDCEVQKSALVVGDYRMQQRELFGIDCPKKPLDILLKGELASAETFQRHLHTARIHLEEELEKNSVLSWMNKDATNSSSDVTSLEFMDSLQDSDRRAMQRTLLELPLALRGTVKKATYKIQETSWGMSLPGFKKYMGAGVVDAGHDMGTQHAAPIVQFTTFFVEEEEATSRTRNVLSLTSLMARKYAEFTNSIDVSRGCLIVEKVFLNKVCPMGQNIGSQATAEQLWAPVWEGGAIGEGDLLPVNKIKEIKLSDVVNWNTYCIVCTAKAVDLGENFQASVDQELKAAKLTRKECTSLPLLEVVKKTNLGRFVMRIIEFWSTWSGVLLECTDVNITFRTDYEFIAGEPRYAMDITIKTSVKAITPKHAVGDQM